MRILGDLFLSAMTMRLVNLADLFCHTDQLTSSDYGHLYSDRELPHERSVRW